MSRRNRWPGLVRASVVCVFIGSGWVADDARAQSEPAGDPSPFAPGDLKRPVFDTRTPIYDMAGQQTKTAGMVVAEVDGRTVTLGDVQDAIAELPPTVKNLPFSELFPGVAARLIGQQALVIRAQRQGLDEDPVVRRKIKAATDRVFANAVLEAEISRSITEAALLQHYNNDIAGKTGPEEVHVRVIMVPTEKQAVDIIGELHTGADFASLARRFSKDATSQAGGDAGFVALDGLTPEIGGVVFSMQPGQVTAFPVRSAGAWFVLKVEERRRQANQPFSAVRENLRQAMLREGAVDVMKAARADVTVREFDFSGQETDASSANDGARQAQ